MPTMVFPRTMQRGRFKGRHFETLNEYQAANRSARKAEHRHRAPAVAGDESKFVLRLVSGTLEISVTGDPRVPEDVDKALEALAAFGSG